MEVKTVGVIGAGISGLVAAKTFLEEGYNVTIFEKQHGIGGVWEKTNLYPGLTTQSPRDTYAFSDYPMPDSYPEWPTGEQVQEYLESYAEHFGVAKCIKFGATVTQVSHKQGNDPGCQINVRFPDGGEYEYEFDFVLVCNGTFGTANIPKIPGMKEFKAAGGQVLHTSQFTDGSVINDKRVMVVGFGKSATDVAAFAADKAKECHLVFRRALWKVPRFFFGLVNMKFLLLSRFSESWMPYRQLKGWERWLHTIGKPLVWAFWRTNETILRLQLPLDACGMVPEQPMDKLVNCSIGMVPKNFYKNVRQGKINARKTEITRMFPGGVELANGEQVATDMVVFGTGFKQKIPFLAESIQKHVIDERGMIHLYRNLMHPLVPRMGFVGYNYSICAQLSSEIGARWLVEYVKDNVKLPSQEAMLAETEADLNWKKQERPFGLLNGACITPFTFHYIDELLRDMGANPQRKPTHPLAEFFMPANPALYKDLGAELRNKKQPVVS